MLSSLLPVRCPLCGSAGSAPCAACVSTLTAAPGLVAPAHLDACHALFRYDRAGARLVAALKFAGRRSLVGWVAAGLADSLGRRPGAVVTWAPTTAARRRGRGFDQAELLARAIARRAGLPCRGLLVREPGPPQTGRDARSRRRAPRFRAAGGVPARIVLVDDVATTGATLSAAARALRCAGAIEVIGLVAARTPLKDAGRRTDHSA